MLQRRWYRPAALVGGLAFSLAAGIGIAVGSDHQDSPDVELNPTMDMTDVYAFPGSAPGRIVLVMNSQPFLTPGTATTGSAFDPNLLYQFKIDNTGDAVEDRVIQVTFTGTGANQQVQVRGPIAPPKLGAMGNTIASADPVLTGAVRSNLGSASGMQLFAGPRDDPFFLDLEAFLCILPDRKPVTGPLGQPCALAGVPPFRPAASAQNYLRNFNVASLIIELPVSQLTQGGNPRIGLWGTISR